MWIISSAPLSSTSIWCKSWPPWDCGIVQLSWQYPGGPGRTEDRILLIFQNIIFCVINEFCSGGECGCQSGSLPSGQSGVTETPQAQSGPVCCQQRRGILELQTVLTLTSLTPPSMTRQLVDLKLTRWETTHVIIDKVISMLNYTDIMSVCTINLLWSVSSFVFFNFLEKAINPGDCG